MDIRPEPPEPLRDGQAGVSLVEIVVAMFLFAIMSVAVLPLLFGAVKASAINRDLVAVTSLANTQLATLEATFPNSSDNSCAAVAAAAATGIADSSGSGATASITVGSCPGSYPATVTVTVRAFRPGSTTASIILNSAILVAAP
ncbi:MAG: type II secretion system protein [Propionibacteriaceae bacterium]|nr:type II secretion system protein [Propionibacteriaceae bacterium]